MTHLSHTQPYVWMKGNKHAIEIPEFPSPALFTITRYRSTFVQIDAWIEEENAIHKNKKCSSAIKRMNPNIVHKIDLTGGYHIRWK